MRESIWEGKWKPTRFGKSVDIQLREDEEMIILRKAAHLCPELLEVLLENPGWSCPFPFECNRFPCGETNCHADMCDDGYAYKYG